MGATGSLLSSLAGQQDDGEEQNEEEWATKQVLRLVLFHEDRRQGFTQWLKAQGSREKPLSAIAFWLDVSLVKLNLMYIASNSEGSKDTQLHDMTHQMDKRDMGTVKPDHHCPPSVIS